MKVQQVTVQKCIGEAPQVAVAEMLRQESRIDLETCVKFVNEALNVEIPKVEYREVVMQTLGQGIKYVDKKHVLKQVPNVRLQVEECAQDVPRTDTQTVDKMILSVAVRGARTDWCATIC